MKKTLISIVTTMSLALSSFVAVYANDKITIYVNDEILHCDIAPFIKDGRTMVPMRKIFEALNAKVDWEGSTQTITATKGNTQIVLKINNYTMYNNGVAEKLDVAPVIIKGSTFVPIRAVSQSLNASVEWFGHTQSVYINSPVLYKNAINTIFNYSSDNKYNRKYIDTTGRTIAEVADILGYDLADFLAQYELPADMPADTYESAAMYSMPLSAVADMYDMSVDELKAVLGLGDDITKTTTWGDAQDQSTLANFVGEESLEQFKEQYGFGDDITGDTKWGDVRPIVDQFERDKMLETKAELGLGDDITETTTWGDAQDQATLAKFVSAGDVSISKGDMAFLINDYNMQLGDIDNAKTAALDNAKKAVLIKAVADLEKIELSDEEQKQITTAVANVKSNYGGDSAFKAMLKEYGATGDFAPILIGQQLYKAKLQEKFAIEDPTDDELKKYMQENYRRAKHVLIEAAPDVVTGDLEKSQAEKILKKAQNGANFDALIKEHSADPGSESNPDGYIFTDNEMVKEFQDGVDSIKPGEFTLVKSLFGYHVIQRLVLDESDSKFNELFEANKDALLAKYKGAKFEEKLESYAKEKGIEVTVDEDGVNAIVEKAKKDAEAAE